MEAADKIRAVERYVEAFEQSDIDIIRELYAADARVEDPVGSPAHDGLEAICTFYEGALASGAKLALSGPPRCAGNSVAFPFQVSMPGIRLDVIDVFEFDQQGRIASMKAYWGPENMASEGGGDQRN
ncbi:MAG: nuclear transport factor 2 family protein [Pseudomonadales bacterium]|nr:nuclear transport factor 2 family protein [Pseudomonadales bacterium]